MSNISTMSPNNVVLSEAEWANATSARQALDSHQDAGKGVHDDSDSDSVATEVTSNTGVSEKPTSSTTGSSLLKNNESLSKTDTSVTKVSFEQCHASGCDKVNPGKCCSGCRTVRYCSPTCQRSHWKAHKDDCRRSPTPPSKPLRRKLPPREKNNRPTMRMNGSSNNINNSNNAASKTRPSRGTMRHANAVLVASRRVPMPVTGRQSHNNATTSDEQSVGGRSKPSVIKVVNDLEEDFENFQEVDDNDRLDNTNPYNSNANFSYSSSGSASCDGTSTSHTSNITGTKFIALTEERIRAHLRDYYEDFDSIFRLGKSSREVWNSFFGQYFTPDIQWVRSSSNSLTGEELAEHFSKDIVGIRMKLVSINSIQILTMGLSAIVTFTADQKFIYRGNPNSDRTVITMVLNVVNGREIRIAHEHRCVGVPVPDNVDWN